MSDVKSIIVFGATGLTGLQMLKTGIDKGLQVTAFVRSPQKIPEEVTSKLYKVIKGDIFDAKQVEDAIECQDAVVSAIGPKLSLFGESTVMEKGCQNIIAGMKKHKVRKLIAISGAKLMSGSGLFNRLLRSTLGMLIDHQKQLDILENETELIDWIVMLPPTIKDSEDVNPEYKIKVNDTPGVFEVTIGELADFSISVLMDDKISDQYKHCKIGISSRPQPPSNNILKIAFVTAMISVFAGVAYTRM